MAKPIAKSAAEGLLPLTAGALTLSEAQPDRITALQPWPGQEAALGEALKAIGLGWPAADRALGHGKATVLWSGRSQAFLLNAAPDGLAPFAALTDLSDGWAGLSLSGPGAAAALARLVPVDLSPGAFPEGASARTGLGHMMLLLHRTGRDAFALYVFRSMLASAVHEIGLAMKSMAARAAV